MYSKIDDIYTLKRPILEKKFIKILAPRQNMLDLCKNWRMLIIFSVMHKLNGKSAANLLKFIDNYWPSQGSSAGIISLGTLGYCPSLLFPTFYSHFPGLWWLSKVAWVKISQKLSKNAVFGLGLMAGHSRSSTLLTLACNASLRAGKKLTLPPWGFFQPSPSKWGGVQEIILGCWLGQHPCLDMQI